MNDKKKVEMFEDLIAWQKARRFAAEIYRVTNIGEFARDWDLRGQLRRSAVSAMSNRWRNEALKLLRELEALSKRERVSPVYIARIYSGLGDRDRALAWLQKSYDEHSDHVLAIGMDPAYDPLRSDPRFIEMLRGIGLPQ
ncbi:MAG: four helix bundle protein [Blastocatellia bacterium]